MSPFPSPTKSWHTDTYAAIDSSRPELSLAGKSVVITGGGSGIGGAIARSCAKAGAARLILIGRREQVLQENKSKIASISAKTEVLLVQADIGNQNDVERAFNTIKKVFGHVDILVHNAAYFSGTASLADEPIDEWFKAFETNVKGSLLTIRGFLQVAIANPQLVYISSAIAHMQSAHFPGFSAYAASKAAGNRVFDHLQSEKPDFHIISIHPGQIATDMAAKVGMTTTIDTAELPADFTVWALSDEARFLKGKLVWANWDVEELKARRLEIEKSELFTFAIEGWPFTSSV